MEDQIQLDVHESEQKVLRRLDELKVPCEYHQHHPVHTIDECLDLPYAEADVTFCKNILLCNRQKTDFYLLLMDGDKPFHTKDLSKQIGSSRLSFAPPEAMEELLGVTPGSATILGLMNDKDHKVRLILDSSVLAQERFGCHPCINTSSLALSMADMREKLLPHLGVEPLLVDLPDDRDAES